MQIEIPFVPAAQRQITKTTTIVEEKEKDTIVIVGQSKTKKRKRTRTSAAGGSQSRGTEIKAEPTSGESAVEAEPFDFASVPNILDDNPDVEDRKPMKKQKKARGMYFRVLAMSS